LRSRLLPISVCFTSEALSRYLVDQSIRGIYIASLRVEAVGVLLASQSKLLH